MQTQYKVPNNFQEGENPKTQNSDRQSGEILEKIAQRGIGGPIPGTIPGQAGWRSEQPGLVEDVPACCRGVGLDDL